jgi:predicted metal-dependent peptidase
MGFEFDEKTGVASMSMSAITDFSSLVKKLEESESTHFMPRIVKKGKKEIKSISFPFLKNEKRENLIGTVKNTEIANMSWKSSDYRYPIFSTNIVREFLELLVEEPFMSSLMENVIRRETGPVIGHKTEYTPIKNEKGEFVLDADGLPTFSEEKVVPITVNTACVWYDPRNVRYNAYYNPIFMSHLQTKEKKDIIKHEMMHILFKHLDSRQLSKNDRSLSMMSNFANDLAINSHLPALPKDIVLDSWVREEVDFLKLFAASMKRNFAQEAKEFSSSPWINWGCDIEKLSDDDIYELIAVNNIATMSPLLPKVGDYLRVEPYMTSEWYMEYLKRDIREEYWDFNKRNILYKPESNKGASGGEHPAQEELDDGEDSSTSEKSEHNRIVSNASRKAKSSNGWGSITSDIQESIEKYLSNEVDWKRQLDFFVKKSARANRSSTFKKTNKRYLDNDTGESLAPGRKVTRESKVWVFIDESGSVDNESLESFFAVLRDLSKHVTFILIPFDTEVKLDEKVIWEKNNPMKEVKRVACGGTSFQCVTDYCNANRSQIEAAIIMTDFCAPRSTPSLVQRLWIGSIIDKRNAEQLGFYANEKVIYINKNKK